jgi:hypothetical protein
MLQDQAQGGILSRGKDFVVIRIDWCQRLGPAKFLPGYPLLLEKKTTSVG